MVRVAIFVVFLSVSLAGCADDRSAEVAGEAEAPTVDEAVVTEPEMMESESSSPISAVEPDPLEKQSLGEEAPEDLDYWDLKEQQVILLEEMAQILEGVHDPASAKAAEARVEDVSVRMAEVAARVEAAPKPEPWQQERAQQEFRARRTEALAKWAAKMEQYPDLAVAMLRAVASVEPTAGVE